MTPGIWKDGKVVETEYGALRGYPDDENTWSWKGIPYAQQPVGELRWKAPRPVKPWQDIREARDFGPPCAQHPAGRAPMVGTEDCLYLNVWRPRKDQQDLPVYVFIHGGGNATGSAGMFPDFHGAILAGKKDLVFVSMNYRMGPFGWFLHPALAKDSAANPLDASGNYGLLDIIFALKWVQNNIAAFGGDPDNVTVAGQSAGGVNVLALLASEEASGLFHRAVSQSGIPMASTMEEGFQRGREIFSELIMAEGAAAMSSAEQADYLRSRSAEDLLDCYEAVPRGLAEFPFNFTDGEVLPNEGFETFSTGTYPNKVPLMIGSNRDEFSLFYLPASPAESRSARYRAAVSFGSLLWKADGVDGIARTLAETTEVYAYYFQWGSSHRGSDSVMPGSWSTLIGASHSMEIPFFFGSQKQGGGSLARPLFTRANRKGRNELSDRMMGYLANFIYTGNPNTPDFPRVPWRPWPQEPGGDTHIIFDAGFDAADIHMSPGELYAEDILNSHGRYMNQEDFSKVMDSVFWR